jgi:hypothetical protein
MLKKIKKLVWKHFGIQENIQTVKAIYNGLLFSQVIQDCPWLKSKGFSLGDFGWSMDALAMHNLFRILEDVKPKNILEFGLGQSSKMVHQYAEFCKANALTIEHDKDWIDYIKTHASQINFNIRQLDLESIKINDVETLSYKNIISIWNEWSKNSDSLLIIIDGPFGQDRYSRPQVLEFISKLGNDFCIFMHDSERLGEQETLSILCEKLNQNGVEFLRKDYGSTRLHTVVCSKSWKFLASI